MSNLLWCPKSASFTILQQSVISLLAYGMSLPFHYVVAPLDINQSTLYQDTYSGA